MPRQLGHSQPVRLPRKGILIRLCIYVPLLGYLSYRAFDRWWAERHPAPTEQDELDRKLAPHKRVITLPDGSQQEIVELTPEQAEELLGPLPTHEPRDPGPAKAPAP